MINFGDFDQSGFALGAYSLTYGVGETFLSGNVVSLIPESSSGVLFTLETLMLLGTYKLTRRNGAPA